MTLREYDTASDLIAERIKELRQRRGWTTKALADVCAERGAPQLTASVLMNIESGRRSEDGRRRRHVTVDEVLALAYALGVAPLALMLPRDDRPFQVTSKASAGSHAVWKWSAGEGPLKPEDAAPLDFTERVEYLATLPEWKQQEQRHQLQEPA